ncbi:kinase-like domain-containing protein [Zopfochytrium polystomum]|nr:kinase-like domain-containing protein [Zopfochytrium polystomum]
MSSSSLTSRAPLPGSIGTKNSGFDDDKDDYIFRQGEVWEDRLHMLRQLGRGSFGQVFEAYDKLKSEHVAIKVIKNRKSFFNQAQTEIRILECLNSKDPDDTKNIVRMKEYFTHRNHLCIIYEKLSHNLYEVLRKVAFEGLSLYLVRRIASQILTTLKLLARPDVQVIHCDLKPENILLRDPTKSNIKVIDFGSSCFCKERTYSYIQSRFYRSPEVIIGHPYTVAIDMWSLGCILVELFCGAPLFCGQSEHDQMFHICDMLGLPPTDFLDKGQPQKVSKIFTRTRSASNSEVGQYRLIPSKESRTGEEDARRQPTASIQGSSLVSYPASVRHSNSSDWVDFTSFVDLVEKMLVFEPSARITPDEALRHPFILRRGLNGG